MTKVQVPLPLRGIGMTTQKADGSRKNPQIPPEDHHYSLFTNHCFACSPAIHHENYERQSGAYWDYNLTVPVYGTAGGHWTDTY